MQPKSPTNTKWLSDIIWLGMLFILLYTLCLGSYPLFTPDEGRYSEVAREMVASGDYITPRVNGIAFLDKPVLYYWLQAIAINLFGVKEWALRLFPALCGVLGCLMTYICGRHLFNRRTGLISAVILATTPLYFGNAHYANLDLEVAVLISCSLLSFITAIQQACTKWQKWFLLSTYFFTALAFLTKGLIAIAFPCLIGGTWILLMQRWDILKKIHLISGILFFLALTLPWYVLVQNANPEFLHFFFVTQQMTRFLSSAGFNNPAPFWFYLPVIVVGFFPWIAFLMQAIQQSYKNIAQSRQQHGTELYLLLWAFIILIFFSIPRSKTLGYILPIFPPLALLVGNFLATAWEDIKKASIYWSSITFTIINVVFATLLLMLPAHQWIEISPNLTPHLTMIAVILSLSAIGSLACLMKKNLFPQFLLCTATSMLFLLTLTIGAKHLNQSTAKPLITQLKPMLQPQDEVVNYFKFYHDVPLYLEQRIKLVANWNAPNIGQKDNWVRELWYGMPFQSTSDFLLDETTFWQHFDSNTRVFVFVNTNYFDQFKLQAKRYFLIGQYNDIILLCNQAIDI